ncbi:MAG: glycosyltransferase family 4 protein [Kiritimatiellia bacterium]
MKLLIACPALPVPVDSGGAVRLFSLIRQLSRHAEVDLVGLDDGTTPAEALATLRPYCRRVEIIIPKRKAILLQPFQVASKMLKGEPFVTKYCDGAEVRRSLRQVASRERYDIIQLEQTRMAGLATALSPELGAKTVLSTYDVASDQYRRMFECERNLARKIKLLLTWLPMRKWEAARAAVFDKVLAVSERDRQLLRTRNSSLDVAVIPNGVDTAQCKPIPRGNRKENILIVGSLDYQPNRDAAIDFHRRVFPLVRNELPGCALTIVGRQPPPSIRALHRPPDVTLCANVPKIEPYHRDALVSVAALRSGGGSRIKILESLAFGTPVVSTSIGCEGLDVRHGRDILVADEPAEFARHIVELMRDPLRWQSLSASGRELVRTRYDWERIGERLRDTYESILCSTRSRKESP